jgi:hypothetical protein
VVEIDLAAPILLGVAIVARSTEILAVRTGGAMAAVAVGTELLRGRIRGMAYVAIEFGMYPHQREFCLRQVIVLDGLPNLVVVAIVTFGAKTPGVRIIGLVAAVAVLRNLVLVHATAMAAETVYFGVPTEQRKPGFLFMIELCGLPFSRGVALAAIAAPLAAVCVVRQVATNAGLGAALVLATQVTAPATQSLVRSGQSKFSFAMVKARAGPAI